MQIPVIKKLIEQYTVEQLEAAENAFLSEKKPEIEIGGEDEGEQLTNVMAAVWIKEEMQKSEVDIKTALRAYTQKVRNSIS